MRKYRCKICGFIVEMEEMPDDYRCPICGEGKAQFEEIVDIEEKRVSLDRDNPALVRIEEKCINCGRCLDICRNRVGIHYQKKMVQKPICIHCGQCILNCPVGALVPRYQYHKVMDYIHDTDKIVVVSTSPAVRVALGEAFSMEPGSFVEQKMVACLRQLGFSYVLDTTFGADLTVMEEASELLNRLQEDEKLPQFTSCCPAWVKYIEMYHPKLLKYLSTTKSPIAMQGSIIKTYFSNMLHLDKENIISVALTPCTAKKYEFSRAELSNNGLKNIDFVLTTSELVLMIKESGIDFSTLKDGEYDPLLGRGSGAGLLFGASGGVMEAALRSAYYMTMKKLPAGDLLRLQEVRGMKGVKEAEVVIGARKLKVAAIFGLPNVEPLLKQLEEGTLPYDFIEVMNCPGGCVGGGGQVLSAISKQNEICASRMEGLYKKEKTDTIRCSNQNKEIMALYRSFLKEPLSPEAKTLLHTSYQDKSKVLGEVSL